MSNFVLKLDHRQAIARHGEASYPREGRGLLLGRRNGTITEVMDLVFVDASSRFESPSNRYIIPGQEMQEGEEIAKAKKLEIIGSFHSLVDQPAKPSIHDREHTTSAFTYVIVGIRNGGAHELTAWKLSDDGTAFFQEDIRSS